MATVRDKSFNSFVTEDKAETYAVGYIPKNAKKKTMQVGVA